MFWKGIEVVVFQAKQEQLQVVSFYSLKYHSQFPSSPPQEFFSQSLKYLFFFPAG